MTAMALTGHGRTAFVLGGGGMLGATEVGMLRALAEREIRPDLVVGTSVGAINGAYIAADPSPAAVQALADLWGALGRSDVFGQSLLRQATTLARSGTHLHQNSALRHLLEEHAGDTLIEDLPVQFQCVAASIEQASAHWFERGPLVEAVLASCAVPGLLPPVRIGDEHFIDGGIVRSLPVGRALELGASTVYVLHVGRIERPLTAPRWPWEVGLVCFEIARRHRFAEDMASLPEDVQVHVLPAGDISSPLAQLRYRDPRQIGSRIDRAHAATSEYLNSRVPGAG
jgi:NTE family protein